MIGYFNESYAHLVKYQPLKFRKSRKVCGGIIPHSHYNILNLGIFNHKNSSPTTYSISLYVCIAYQKESAPVSWPKTSLGNTK